MKPIKRATSTINFGYVFNEDTGLLDVIKDEIKELEFIEKEILERRISLRQASVYLKNKTGKKISAPGLKKHMEKKYKKGCCSAKLYPHQGFVYVLICESIQDWVKFGQTFNTEKRIYQYNIATPLRDFKIIHSIKVKNKKIAERKILDIASFFSKEEKGEWKKINLEFAKNILNIYEDKYETK